MTERRCEQFYRDRDARTGEYLRSGFVPRKTIAIHVGTAAARSAVGQHLALSMTNLLARVHRRIHFAVSGDPGLVATAASGTGTKFTDGLVDLARSIDPCGVFTVGSDPRDINIGVAPDGPVTCDWYLGAHRSLAHLAREHVPVGSDVGSMRGAALAACLGASAALKAEVGLPSVPRTLSAWNYAEGDEADYGPATLDPLDVGRVLMVGAGAVASALTYWLWQWGVRGEWTIVDADLVKLHNTNRGMLFLPKHAGWPAGVPERKSELLARFLPNPEPVPAWYDEAPEIVERQFDVVLLLANDRNVRHFVSHRNATVTLQATTGRNWLSQLHRHVAGLDDCPSCRLDDVKEPQFACSTGPTAPGSPGEGNDAALPFLSAASGLMLATLLQRLQAGVLIATTKNNWRWDFLSEHQMASGGRSRCIGGCRNRYARPVRAHINAETRWAHLDV
jgi:hypothetical protein